MNTNSQEIKQISAQLLAGLLANPHIYAAVSDEGGTGQQEEKLVLIAITMAKHLIEKAEIDVMANR